jgi:hypothetical protein
MLKLSVLPMKMERLIVIFGNESVKISNIFECKSIDFYASPPNK